MAKAVAKKENGAVVPDFMKGHMGEGQDDIGQEDILMPRIKLGQSMTPEVKDGKADEGDFIHNVTGEVLCKAGEPLRIIPIAYAKEYILWRDRKNGGGIMARAKKVKDGDVVRYKWDKPNQIFEDKLGGSLKVKYETKNFIDEDHLNEWGSSIPDDKDSQPAATEHHNYVVVLPDHDNMMIALSLSRTATPKARMLNTMLKMGNVPTYARVYSMSSVPEQSDENKYANYHFDGGFTIIDDENTFNQLRELHLGWKGKSVQADLSDLEGSEESDREEAF